MVGLYQDDYPGYRPMRLDEWHDVKVVTAAIEAHQAGQGWSDTSNQPTAFCFLSNVGAPSNFFPSAAVLFLSTKPLLTPKQE